MEINNSLSFELGILLALVVLYTGGENIRYDSNHCSQIERYNATITVIEEKPVRIKKYIWCAALPTFRCSRYTFQTKNVTRHKIVEKTRDAPACCAGYEADGHGACKPVCIPKCDGVCVAPNDCVCGPTQNARSSLCRPPQTNNNSRSACSSGDISDEEDCPLSSTTPKPCGDWQFACDNGACIMASWRCDRQYDCSDKSDERNCTRSTSTTPRPACSHYQFKCSSGECVNKILRCDGSEDCEDGSDERGCRSAEQVQACGPNHFQCWNKLCIPKYLQCDGKDDCLGDSSDEINCPVSIPTKARASACSSDEFQCSTGKCIRVSYRCDGENDCLDMSDERNCQAYIVPY